MKRFFFASLLSVAVLAIYGCDEINNNTNGSDGGYVDKWAGLVNETPHDAIVDGNKLTYGEHVYTINGEIDFNALDCTDPTAFVTFTHVPSGVTEFKAVYDKLLGKHPHGAAAMIPMAMEIYARKKETGKACLEYLCKDDDAAKAIIRELDRKFPSSQSSESDYYIQRYLPAALLAGAAYDNAYTPGEPYTVEMVSVFNIKPSESLYPPYGTNYQLHIFGPGWDKPQRGVDLFLPKNKEYFKVVNCPGCYSQCKVMDEGTWQGLK